MKANRVISVAATLLLLATIIYQPSTAHSQGALTPPGPPAPTMITLAQIEPRTPISSAPFTITAPGSYYLTTNLTVSGGDAITIATSGVTIGRLMVPKRRRWPSLNRGFSPNSFPSRRISS